MKTNKLPFLLLLLSFSVLANPNINDLEVGTKLHGKDKVSKRDCTLEVINVDESDKRTYELEVTTSDEAGIKTLDRVTVAKSRLPINTRTYKKEIRREVDPFPARRTMVVEAFLSQSYVTDNAYFRITYTNYYESYYRSSNAIDCSFKNDK